MLVTLGLTTYNAVDTVRAAAESVLAQDWDPIEIIIVDDASSDGTGAILEEYRKSDGRVRLLLQETNRGVAAVRNLILGEARGEFVAFFDDDDVSAPNRTRLQLAPRI